MTDRTDLGLTDSNAGCACCAGPDTSDQTVSANAAATQEVLVSGMTCSHCVSSVTEELTAIDGVENVSVELNAGGTSRVTIHSAAPVDVQAVQAAVEEAGYTLEGASA
ncbi:heavy-metal-associated domain-containing protein [Microbacterium sp. H37-C3]|uniref:heavy-metal-associated domain-containing protein n=1 Tax=Microbacterium sp. H37-C3 TaxID=3004354 RepID=UPI0022AFFC81|nr:heavy-metal-associated domain-containing protein [Microbacterium sp. H37-C3]MCZ4068817.1 heavy-metal-associated domain-containing protein [Microbacterium sp. H37-C3]